jgi:hypothetical protein
MRRDAVVAEAFQATFEICVSFKFAKEPENFTRVAQSRIWGTRLHAFNIRVRYRCKMCVIEPNGAVGTIDILRNQDVESENDHFREPLRITTSFPRSSSFYHRNSASRVPIYTDARINGVPTHVGTGRKVRAEFIEEPSGCRFARRRYVTRSVWFWT